MSQVILARDLASLGYELMSMYRGEGQINRRMAFLNPFKEGGTVTVDGVTFVLREGKYRLPDGRSLEAYNVQKVHSPSKLQKMEIQIEDRRIDVSLQSEFTMPRYRNLTMEDQELWFKDEFWGKAGLNIQTQFESLLRTTLMQYSLRGVPEPREYSMVFFDPTRSYFSEPYLRDSALGDLEYRPAGYRLFTYGGSQTRVQMGKKISRILTTKNPLGSSKGALQARATEQGRLQVIGRASFNEAYDHERRSLRDG